MNKKLKPKRNLTRFTYKNMSFQGWRLCISRGGKSFVKYFSDKKWGGSENALSAAEQMLMDIRGLFAHSKKSEGRITGECLEQVSQIIKK